MTYLFYAVNCLGPFVFWCSNPQHPFRISYQPWQLKTSWFLWLIYSMLYTVLIYPWSVAPIPATHTEPVTSHDSLNMLVSMTYLFYAVYCLGSSLVCCSNSRHPHWASYQPWQLNHVGFYDLFILCCILSWFIPGLLLQFPPPTLSLLPAMTAQTSWFLWLIYSVVDSLFPSLFWCFNPQHPYRTCH